VTAFDWDGARRRLEAARLALADEPSPEEERALLEERARALALAPEREPDGPWQDVVVFTLGGERFAVEAGQVAEAVELDAPTPLPGTPDFLLGVINHRGRVLGVYDLRERLGRPRDGELAHAVAVEAGGLCFAIAVEAVEETTRERLDRTLVTLVDVEALAADPRLRIEDE